MAKTPIEILQGNLDQFFLIIMGCLIFCEYDFLPFYSTLFLQPPSQCVRHFYHRNEKLYEDLLK